jgi:hypothetical protein
MEARYWILDTGKSGTPTTKNRGVLGGGKTRRQRTGNTSLRPFDALRATARQGSQKMGKDGNI